jgi:type I restriction enzyme S subunit
MELRPGYKQTEVGVIPDDWRVASVGDLALKVGSGITPTGGQRVYRGHGRPFVRSQNVGWGDLLLDDIAYIDEATHSCFPDTEIRLHDVLLNITGASIGRSALADVRLVGGNVNQHVCIIRANSRELVPGFLNSFLVSDLGQRQIESFQAGGNRQGLNFAQVRSMRITLPSTESEQRAIAAALSDVDALLSGLDRLIAKKRDLKQAAMQQLLTGQTRLPGFYGKWTTKELGTLGEICGAGVDKKIRPGEQPVRLVNYMDVYRRSVIYSKELDHHVTARTDQAIRCAVKKGDIFFTPSSEMPFDIAASAVAMEDIADACYSYHVVRLRLDEDWDLRFRAYGFKTQSFLDEAARTSEGSGVRYVITQAKFRHLTVRYPTEKGEQAAIAEVLTDMDAELAALERRREKTRALKQAMMQELLTGKTRLATARHNP